MIERLKELFSFNVTSPAHKVENLSKVELVSCPIKMIMCNVHLSVLNSDIIESEVHHKKKDYGRSIESLKSAFEKSNTLLNHPCLSCADHYRFKIFESLENIHDELEKKSKGFFSKRKYKRSYMEAKKVLLQLTKEGVHNQYHFNNSTPQFLGNHLN
jgi:hypothetical protein